MKSILLKALVVLSFFSWGTYLYIGDHFLSGISEDNNSKCVTKNILKLKDTKCTKEEKTKAATLFCDGIKSKLECKK